MRKLALLLFLILLLSCEKNEAPTCVILEPSENVSFTRGEPISVSVKADDSDGLVSEVRLYLNHIGISALDNFPYTFELPSDELELGIHTLTVTAIDNEGLEGSDEIQINIDAEAPSLSTADVSIITLTTAISGGDVHENGGAEVLARGVCWSTSQNPSVSDSLTQDGSGLGSYVSSISGLTCGTTYYVRAYASNSKGTSYGEQRVFTTDFCLSIPTVLTSALSNITEAEAKGGGIVTDDGGAEIMSRGVCWSIDSNPSIDNNHSTDGNGSGSYTSELSGLSCETTYYVRAYATNSEGTAYGAEEIFTTEYCTTMTDYDGNTYQTARIGDQIWMTQNLKVTHYADGSPLPIIEDGTDWSEMLLNEKGYCWYNNNVTIGNTYGALYNWAAAMNGGQSSESNPSNIQGVCPSGWHLPSHDEWKQLEMYVGMSQADADMPGWRGTDEGGKLKSMGTDYWYSPNTGANNLSGFTSIPSGYRIIDGSFLNLGIYAIYWSATEGNSTHAWYRHLENDKASSGSNFYDKRAGLTIRCVRD